MRVLSVRAARPEDAPALADLCAAHAAYEGLDYQAAGHAQRLHAALHKGRLHAWLALQDETAVGYVSVTLDFATLSAQPFLHMDCLYLAPEARGQGRGHALMQVAQAFGKAQGCSTMQWQTPDWNQAALQFYERTGARGLAKQRYTLALY